MQTCAGSKGHNETMNEADLISPHRRYTTAGQAERSTHPSHWVCTKFITSKALMGGQGGE